MRYPVHPICFNILYELGLRTAPLPPMAEKALQDYGVCQDIVD